MEKTHWVCVALALSFFDLVILAPAGWADRPSPPDVKIAYRQRYLEVEVTQTTILSTLLREVCRQTGAHCEIRLGAADSRVPPIRLRGTWQDVIFQLLQGSRTNYVVLAPGVGTKGSLIVEPRGPALGGSGDSAAIGATAEEKGASETSQFAKPPVRLTLPTGPGEAGQTDEQEPEISRSSPSQIQPPEPTNPEEIGQTNAHEREGMRDVESATEASVQSTPAWGDIPAVDAIGGPPSPPPPATPLSTEPLPQALGMPLNPPTSHGRAPSELPFPDDNGNPIPVADLPLRGTPFLESDGNPIAVTPLLGSQKPGSPFPPDGKP